MSALGRFRPGLRASHAIDVRFAPRATLLLRGSEMTRWASIGHIEVEDRPQVSLSSIKLCKSTPVEQERPDAGLDHRTAVFFISNAGDGMTEFNLAQFR